MGSIKRFWKVLESIKKYWDTLRSIEKYWEIIGSIKKYGVNTPFYFLLLANTYQY